MNITKRSIKFAAGDRVRVAQTYGGNIIRVGLTGTISSQSVGVVRKLGDRTPGYLVKFDKKLNLYPAFEGNILMYADELEYEDNRDDAIFGEIIAWNLDYVWFQNDTIDSDMSICSDGCFATYQLFSNMRKGDTAFMVRCTTCGEVIGSNFPISIEQVKNVSYLCRYPLTYEDALRDVNFEVQND